MEPFEIKRPWGSFRQFTQNVPVTVKVLRITGGEQFSLQHHQHRSEFWHILSGTPDVRVGDVVTHAHPGDEFTIPAGVAHRITATNGDVACLEISSGDFDEEDIVREEDKYGRA